MIEIKNKKDCCGCTACKNVCPKNAIEMEPDFEGFLYPKINKEKCINCGLCNKVCPIINKKITDCELEEAYTLRSIDKDNLLNSTSGGFFKPLGEYIIKQDGIVYGVGFDEKYNVIHKKAVKKEELDEFRGSKYVQSDLKKSFTEIKSLLDNNKIVLFSGTPCQIEGLIKFLRKKYDNLITIDVVCKGVPSQKLWIKYLEYQQNHHNSKVKEIHFRNKTYGYHSGTMKIVFENNKEYYGSGRVDLMLKSYYNEIASRPSCYDCKFKSKNHISDITIYDCWNIETLVNGVKDDDKGYTNIVIHTIKGKKLFNNIKDKYMFYSVDISNQIKCDGIMVENSAKMHKMRSEFYKELDKKSINNVVQELIPISKKDYIIEKTKKIFYNFGILKVLKKIKRK